MTLHLPTLPLLPTAWRRQPEPAEVWPGNPRTVADDLRIAQANEAHMSRLLVAARKDADIEAARADDAERRAASAEAAHQAAAAQLVESQRTARELRQQLSSGLREFTPLSRRLTRMVTAYARCRAENTALRAANRSLSRQLEDAIYTPEQCAILAAGGASKTTPTSAGAVR